MWLFALTAGALFAGCENSVSLALDLPREDLVALAFLPKNGGIRAFALREGEAPGLELEEGDRAYAFVVGHAELSDLARARLPLDATAGAGVRLSTDPVIPGKGSCGFCVLPAAEPPQRVAPGDSCPLPPFARVLDLAASGAAVEDGSLEETRKMILVDWPGTCP